VSSYAKYVREMYAPSVPESAKENINIYQDEE
jgi:hypothetical protein